MKRQKTKAEKLQIKAHAISYGVSESAIAIVGNLVLVHRIDPHILALMPPHLPSMQQKCQTALNCAVKVSGNSQMMTS